MLLHTPCKDCGVRDPNDFHSELSSRCKECEEQWAMGETDDDTDDWAEE